VAAKAVVFGYGDLGVGAKGTESPRSFCIGVDDKMPGPGPRIISWF